MFQIRTSKPLNTPKAGSRKAIGKSKAPNIKRHSPKPAQSFTKKIETFTPLSPSAPSNMNTPKHTFAIRAACCALVPFDALLPVLFPHTLPLAMLVGWLLGSVTLALALAPIKSRFSL